jgi:mono/diheme cytochrome c family protein
MLKPFLLFSTLVLTGALAPAPPAQEAASPAPAPAFKIPPEAASQVNPVKPTADSRARSKKVYGYECAVCHGDDGSGAGDMAKSMKAKMPDFRDPSALKGRTDGELFYIIKNGKGEMDGEGERLKPDDTWNMVTYIRSFAKLQAAADRGPA